MSSNSHQVGGDHYKSGFQHWDLAYELYGSGYFQGQITKYIYRWRLKNGTEDLKKALHFLQKLIELTALYKSAVRVMLNSDLHTLQEFALVNKIPDAEFSIITKVTICTPDTLRIAERELVELIRDQEAGEAGGGYIDQG